MAGIAWNFANDDNAFNVPKAGQPLVGCQHYRRRCSLICDTCAKAYTCRFCHDEAVTGHKLDRKAVQKIVCLVCNTVQQVGAACSSCHTVFGLYFCSICRLYDDEDRGQYHCFGCEICRMGGRENFFHCPTCNLCLSIALLDNHNCVVDMSRSDCPVCLEDLHTSRNQGRVPACGHMIHDKCLKRLQETGDHACPTCRRPISS